MIHHAPMLSLAKAHAPADVADWAAGVAGPIVATPKVDGLALGLVYDAAGELVRVATRGDGTRGHDVTDLAIGAPGVLRRIAAGPCEVRGELYARDRGTRHEAAGALRAGRSRRVALVAYEIFGERERHATYRAKLARLQELGFAAVPVLAAVPALAAPDLDSTPDASWPYRTDGLVLRVDYEREYARLGATAHHPRGAIAWKPRADGVGTTTIRSVEWSAGPAGTLRAAAVVDPVNIGGVSIGRVVLGGESAVQGWALRIGDVVEVGLVGGSPVLSASLGGGTAPVLAPSDGARRRVLETGRLAGVPGVTPLIAARLWAAGARTPAALSAMSEAALLRVPGLGPAKARRIILARRELAPLLRDVDAAGAAGEEGR